MSAIGHNGDFAIGIYVTEIPWWKVRLKKEYS